MKNEWEIVNEFTSGGIQCFIVKWERGERPDRSWADFNEDGFYQYNGYCVSPTGYSLRGIVDEYEYEFLRKHLKNSYKLANYKKGKPRDYNVHGGITYRDWGYGDHKQYPSTEWILGFDTGHLGDSETNSMDRGYKKGRRLCQIRMSATRKPNIGGNKMSEKWVLFLLYADEMLECTTCSRYLRRRTVHLYIVDDRIDEVMCDMCWKKNQKEINDETKI